MKPLISTAAICLLLPTLVLGSFEMAFDNYAYGEGRAPRYRSYDDNTCNRIPPVDGQPNTIISIALRSTTEGINVGYNTHPPPAVAFYISPNPSAPGPHCVDSQLVMIAKYYNYENIQEFFFTPLGAVTHFRVVDDEEGHAFRMWRENSGPRDESNGNGVVVWADGNRWRTSLENNVMVRVLGYDWSEVIEAGEDWIPSSDDSDLEEAVEEEEEEEGWGDNGGGSIGFSDLPGNYSDAGDSPRNRVEVEVEEQEDEDIEELDFPTEAQEVERQERYHTQRILQLSNLQDRQRARAMEFPRTATDRLMVARNDEIDGGNYTPIPPSQRHRSYGELLDNGWYIDPEQELRARWQEYMTIAFLRFKARHGIADNVSADELTQRQRDLFVDFLRRDGTPLFFQDLYMRPITNSHAQQQLINSFGPPVGMAGGREGVRLNPNPFLQFDQDFDDAIENGARRNINANALAQQRLDQRREELQRQNQIANRRAIQMNMVQNDGRVLEMNPARRLALAAARRGGRGGGGIHIGNFENDMGARSRIIRDQRRNRRPVNRQLADEIDAAAGVVDENNPWDEFLADEMDAGWRLPLVDNGGPPAPVPSLDAQPNQVPAPLFGFNIPAMFLRPPPSPSTEAENNAEENAQEVAAGDDAGEAPQLARFDSSGSGSVA
ncbi:hypothetical protein TWF718_009925 [Orbilia javanica]|uniref:Uncharacterized protein n=1 Tax=Orbilia javanica TaxID=47235 RepID=A0AAN8N0H2_9PEZI